MQTAENGRETSEEERLWLSYVGNKGICEDESNGGNGVNARV